MGENLDLIPVADSPNVASAVTEMPLATAEEMFGGATTLVVDSSNEAISGVASLGGLYQVAIGIVALLFTFILVRYYALFRHLILSAISRGANRPDLNIFSSEIRNIEIFTSIAGVSLLSLFVMRLTVMESFQSLLSPLSDISAWGVGAMVFGATFLLILFERGILYLAGLMSQNARFCEEIWHVKLLLFSTTIILLSPPLILTLLTEGTTTQIALYCSVAVCLISLILFIKETFLLFQAQRFSIFHWILYLCALEIFPISLLVAPILRQGF